MGLSWGAIRESDPFMLGSQPSVFTVSPMAPARNNIGEAKGKYKQNLIFLTPKFGVMPPLKRGVRVVSPNPRQDLRLGFPFGQSLLR